MSTGINTKTHSALRPSALPRGRSTIAAVTNPHAQVRLMNSYMLPQGTRVVATPRSTMHSSSSPIPR
ncbi:Uncharacterised protein [Mycobacteroides abscessus subsp. abscessus]|nr:Uncharacterised protein [Mycobacteroides abscessus subsp. abscessus]